MNKIQIITELMERSVRISDSTYHKIHFEYLPISEFFVMTCSESNSFDNKRVSVNFANEKDAIRQLDEARRLLEVYETHIGERTEVNE